MRSSAVHWRDLTELLGRFERCVEASSRLDAYRGLDRLHQYAAFDDRLDRLRLSVDHEVSRVTVERLDAALVRRKAAA